MKNISPRFPKLRTEIKPVHLTHREKECLTWAARGKSSEETAMILSLKATTVSSYREQLKNKLKCVTMAQAVYEGIKRGWII